jgi:Holliday junction resolvase RusA-like endonuclease
MPLKISIPVRNQILIKIPIFGKVRPLQRPRVGRSGHVYQPKENQLELIDSLSVFSDLKIDEPCIIDLYVHFQGQIDKYPASKNYGDVDNLAKAVLDALVANQILTDDGIVLGGSFYKSFSDEDFAVIVIWSVQNSFSDLIS